MKNLFIALAIAALFTAGCAKKEAPNPSAELRVRPEQSRGTKPKEAVKEASAPQDTPSDGIQQKILSFNLEGLSEKGEKKWEVNGESAEAVSENRIKLNNIVAKSYGNEAEATITADKGIYDKTKNNVTLEENVKATVENMQNAAGDYISLPGNSPDAKKKTRTVITCDGEVQFDYENNLAFFDKNVKVVSDYGEITSDKITIHLDTKTKRIVDIVAEGSVKIVRGENTTYSDKATYIESEKKVVLTGRPRLVIYQEGDMNTNISGI